MDDAEILFSPLLSFILFPSLALSFVLWRKMRTAEEKLHSGEHTLHLVVTVEKKNKNKKTVSPS